MLLKPACRLIVAPCGPTARTIQVLRRHCPDCPEPAAFRRYAGIPSNSPRAAPEQRPACGAAAESGLTGVAGQRHRRWMNELLVGYPRVSTEQQDLHRTSNGLHALGVRDDPIRRSWLGRRELRVTRASIGPSRLPSRRHVGRHQAGPARPVTACRPRHPPRVDERETSSSASAARSTTQPIRWPANGLS
jgi:hypothetical protein